MGKAIVSLERAYHMFLKHDNASEQSDNKLTKFEYLVYSQFMRFGCNLKRFKNVNPTLDISSSLNSQNNIDDEAVSEKSYIWNYLNELLGHRKTLIASKNLDQKYYDSIKQSMDTIITGIRDADSNATQSIHLNCSTSETTSESQKRKLLSDHSCDNTVTKLIKLNHNKDLEDPYMGSGSTNDFMVGNEFQRFKHIFEQIDIIELKSMDHYDDQTTITEKFSFDLWTSLDYRKTQHTGPNFRLIVK